MSNIYNKVPDEDGEREIVDLWYDDGQNPSYEEWYNHLGSLIEKLKSEYKKLGDDFMEKSINLTLINL